MPFVTESWANFHDRVEALDLGIDTQLLYRELCESSQRSLVTYIMYLRSELEVYRQWLKIKNTRAGQTTERRLLIINGS
jgi:hypothetical protein